MAPMSLLAMGLMLLLTGVTWSQEVVPIPATVAQPEAPRKPVESQSTAAEATLQPVSFLQPQSFVPAPPPRLEARPNAANAAVPESDVSREFNKSGLRPSRVGEVRQRQTPPIGYRVPPSDASLRAATDAGNHVGKNPAAPPVWTQQRNPVVTDSRISGSRVGRVAGSGSHWVPARIDLDTMLNKFDSRTLGDVTVIPGPYTVRHGPDFQYFQVDMLPSPRADELHVGGSTGLEFKSNGEQWMGRQTIFGANTDWGYRLGYTHRTGNDYRTGGDNPEEIAASFNSRAFDLALGKDLSHDQHLEFHLLRLDQTNVELPGQAFDIDSLVTNGFEAEYLVEDSHVFDQSSFSVWYNDTKFSGSAQGSGKRRVIQYLDALSYVGFTNVRGMSTGYRYEGLLEVGELGAWSVGTDFRFLRQQLNEFSQGQNGVNAFQGNSPVPRSVSINPGLFSQYALGSLESVRLTIGGRLDLVATEVTDDAAKLNNVTLSNVPISTALGTSDLDQDFILGSLFVTGERQLNDLTVGFAGAGFAMRPPTLTELYAAQSFLFLLQNGLNAVTGDPRLAPEKLWQLDIGLRVQTDRARGSARAFHAWINDYITFENAGVTIDQGAVQQVDLHYINTRLATLAGIEFQGEYDVTDMLTGFSTVAYVQGANRTPTGGGHEALPMIPPLTSRLGGRFHQAAADPKWGIELSAQVVAAQDRVASSLLENQTPGYTTYDARAFWEPTASTTVFAGIENFTDKAYRTHFDFKAQNGRQILQPGASFYLGAETRY